MWRLNSKCFHDFMQKLLIGIFVAVVTLLPGYGFSETLTAPAQPQNTNQYGDELMKPNERNEYAQSMFLKRPELFPENRRPSILKGIIELGMTPFEAKLAGGAFAFKVGADPSRWQPNPDPYNVMWAQSISPDNSEITMTFNNSTQFGGGSKCMFRVCFTKGCATLIEKVEGKKNDE